MNGPVPLPETFLLYALYLWALVWKGLALWRAGKQSQKIWFIVLLVLNTVGILDIIFLFRFSKNRMTFKEITTWFNETFTSGKKKSK